MTNGLTKVTSLEEMVKASYEELRVANYTQPNALARSVLCAFEENKRVAMSCIGAQAVAQAFKAIAIANGEAIMQGVILAIVPTFDKKVVVDRDSGRDIELTAIRMIVMRAPLAF